MEQNIIIIVIIIEKYIMKIQYMYNVCICEYLLQLKPHRAGEWSMVCRVFQVDVSGNGGRGMKWLLLVRSIPYALRYPKFCYCIDEMRHIPHSLMCIYFILGL